MSKLRASPVMQQEETVKSWYDSGMRLTGMQGGVKTEAPPPSYLDGSLPADVGFDPMYLTALADPELGPGLLKGPWSGAERKALMESKSEEEQAKSVQWMRESEIKHGRLAMLAAVGWVWAEMFTPFSFALMETNGRAPSLFNGGLFSFPTSIGFLLMMGIFAGAETAVKAGPNGDLGFDPLNVKQAVTLSQNEELKAAE